jgi:acetyltransferase-like isoleucine patch superfamily enzyme
MTISREFKEIGDNVVIYDPVTIIRPSEVVLKSNIIISEYSYLSGGSGLYIGNYIHISTQSTISGGGYCILEDFVGLSAGVRIITGSEEIDGKALTNPTIPDEYRSFYRSYVHCKKHSFFGSNVIIYPNVTIGEGTVVSSGSIVNKDLEPWSIYAGNPLRRIRQRPKDIILEKEKELLKKFNIKNANFKDVINLVKK